MDRIISYLDQHDFEEGRNHDPNHRFRDIFFVDINEKIHESVFFDSGREKPFREFSHRKGEMIDAFFETTVSDLEKDHILKDFVRSLGLKKIIPSDFPSKQDLEAEMKKMALSFIGVVSSFFGGVRNHNEISLKCSNRIDQLKREKKTNIIYLGELKGCGVCRHRSIMYKLLCDYFGIPCRILRGWIRSSARGGKYVDQAHMWNEVVIFRSSNNVDHHLNLVVDSSNFPTQFVDSQIVGKYYINLGHPQKRLRRLHHSMEYIQKTYNQCKKRGDHLGGGAFGNVFELKGSGIFLSPNNNNNNNNTISFKKMDLAVKEVNVSSITTATTNNNIINSSSSSSSTTTTTTTTRTFSAEKYIRKEIETMELLYSHKNIVEMIGSFTSFRNNREKIVHIVMKKYDMNGLSFLQLLLNNNNNNSNNNKMMDIIITPEKKMIESLIFLMEVASGLVYIHSFGIIHFDIKLSNIMVDWDAKKQNLKEVRITDFGSSKTSEFHLLLTSLPVITRKYAAPEILKLLLYYDNTINNNQQQEDDEIEKKKEFFTFSSKSDVYSFGVLMKQFRRFYEGVHRIHKLEDSCLKENPSERPSMCEVLYHLKGSLIQLKQKKQTEQKKKNKKKKKNLIGSSKKYYTSNLECDYALRFYEKGKSLMDEKSEFQLAFDNFQIAESFINIIPLNDHCSSQHDDPFYSLVYSKILKSMGDCSATLGNFESAIKYYQKALNVLKRNKNMELVDKKSVIIINIDEFITKEEEEDSADLYIPEVANILDGMGMTWIREKKYGEAMKKLKTAQRIRERIYHQNKHVHPDMATSYYNLSILYFTIGEMEECLKYHKKSLSIRKELYNYVITSKSNQQNIKKEEEEGEEDCKNGHHLDAHKLLFNVSDLANSYKLEGLIQMKSKQYQKSLTSLLKSLEIMKTATNNANNNLEISNFYDTLGILHKLMKNYKKSITAYQKCLEIREKKLPTSHYDLIRTYKNIGLFYEEVGDLKRAGDFYELAIPSSQKNLDRVNKKLILMNKQKKRGGGNTSASSGSSMFSKWISGI